MLPIPPMLQQNIFAVEQDSSARCQHFSLRSSDFLWLHFVLLCTHGLFPCWAVGFNKGSKRLVSITSLSWKNASNTLRAPLCHLWVPHVLPFFSPRRPVILTRFPSLVFSRTLHEQNCGLFFCYYFVLFLLLFCRYGFWAHSKGVDTFLFIYFLIDLAFAGFVLLLCCFGSAARESPTGPGM